MRGGGPQSPVWPFPSLRRPRSLRAVALLEVERNSRTCAPSSLVLDRPHPNTAHLALFLKFDRQLTYTVETMFAHRATEQRAVAISTRIAVAYIAMRCYWWQRYHEVYQRLTGVGQKED